MDKLIAPVEVEAKYAVPDAGAFQRLLAMTELSGCALVPAGEARVIDHYLDTAGRDLRRLGWACRLRESEPGRLWAAALKGISGAAGVIPQREEFEIEIAPGSPPAQWSASAARDLTLSLGGGQSEGNAGDSPAPHAAQHAARRAKRRRTAARRS